MKNIPEGAVPVYHLKEGVKDGFYKISTKNISEIWSGGNVVNGKQEGKWVDMYYGATQKIYNYKEGKLFGEQVELYESSQLKAKYYVGVDTLQKPSYVYNPDTVLAVISVDKVIDITFYPDHSVSAVSYHNPELDIYITLEYDENGNKKQRVIMYPLTGRSRTTKYDEQGNVINDFYYPR